MTARASTGADPTEMAAVAAFRDLLATRWVGYAIHAAAVLGIPDLLAGGPRTADGIAAEAGADPVALDRLLRALSTIGLVRLAGEAYELQPIGAVLCSNAPEGMRNQVLLTGGERSLDAWAKFVECVRTGRTASQILDGLDDPFAWFAERPEEQAKFDAAMASGTTAVARAVLDAYDFSGISTIVDVGGGYGTLLVEVLRAYPTATGVVFDRPHCRDGAESRIAGSGLADRYRFEDGDFFAVPLPAGADAYVLKSVVHDWDDEKSMAILRRCREAMRDESRLLLIEAVLPDDLDGSAEHRRMVWADLNMLVATGGRERTESQYRALLKAEDLSISRIIPTDTPTKMSVVEVLPA